MDDMIGTLSEFWAEAIDVWENGLFGVDISQILIALAIFFAFLVLRGLFTRLVLDRLHRWASKTTNRVDDVIIDALIPPIRFVPIILGLFFAFQSLDMGEGLHDISRQIIRSLIAFTIFWGLYRAIEPVGRTLKGLERLLTPAMVQWMLKVLRVVLVFIGAAVILEIWGIAIGPLLAGLGLFGAAVALGAQDMFKNLIGGLTIITEKRFHPGEWIRVDGVVEGTVMEIGFRSTAIRRFDKAPVHVPNSQLSDAALTNFSRMTHRRIYWTIGVTYSTTTEQLKTIRDGILAYLDEQKEVFDLDVTTFVRVDSFNASSIDIMLYCFTKTTVWGEWLEIKEALAFAIKDIVENQAGASFAFPSTSLYIESLPEDRPEIFTPPAEKN